MSHGWSTASLPITLHASGFLFFTIVPLVWLGFLLFWCWAIFGMGWSIEDRHGGALTGLIAAAPIMWLVKLARGTHRPTFRVTQDGVAIQRGSKLEADRFAACSEFTLRGSSLLLWKAETARGSKNRYLSRIEYGLADADMRTLAGFLNELRASAASSARAPR